VTAKKSYKSSPITRIVLDGETRDLRTTAHHSFKTDSGWERLPQGVHSIPSRRPQD
jgi:hypothetical protein